MFTSTLTGLAGLSLVVGLNGGLVPAAHAAPPTGTSSLADVLGARPGATRLPVPVSDRVQASVDVGTGNLMVQVRALDLRGVSQDTSLGLTHNSRAELPYDTSLAHPRWNLAIGGAGKLTRDNTRINFTAADGSVSVFTPVAGSTTAFTPGPGVKADLVKTGTGYALASRTTATVVAFDDLGRATGVADRNGNTTTIGHKDWNPINVTATKGQSGARRATIEYSGGVLSGFSQTNGYEDRRVGIDTNPAKDLAKVTDATGKDTTFAYDADHRITAIVSPTGATTRFTYDADGRVTTVTAVNTAAGAGNSVTRIAYPTGQTLVAGPNTDQSAAVTAVPHATYTLTGTGRVSKVVDAAGRERAATYTADFDTLTSTRGTGTGAGTTTNTFGANGGQSITASKSPGGATNTLDYANTAANTAYLPTSGTDDAGNTSLYTYNGAGNMLTSTDALAATATLTRNPDGTVATATAPGNGTNKTTYTHNSLKELTSITPVTGSTLGARTFTYDIWGRTATATNGAGVTATYAYDANDRVLSITHSDGKANTSFTYTPAGQVATRTDPNGTTTHGYDELGRLVSRVNTAGGGTIAYGYDLASNLVSTTDSRGRTEYVVDDAGTMTTLKYLINGVRRNLEVATDAQGRRTDAWLQSSPSHTMWKAHNHTTYDSSGRVSRVTARAGEGESDNSIVMDLSYCYAAGTTAPDCTTTAANDRAKLQWTLDHATGATTSYTYDAAGRLTRARTTGGQDPKTHAYTYDERGNRLTATTTNAAGTTTATQTLAFNAANQVTTTGYAHDGAGNLTADPAGTYAYNGAGQLVESTKTTGASYAKTYAGTSQNEVLTQQSPTGNYAYTYGRTDAQGLPVIEQVKHDSLTAYVEHDPATGEPLMLRTASGMQSLYVHDGTGNPAALITSTPYTAFAYDYDPYGTATLTENSGGYGVPQNPYAFKNGTQDRATGWIKYGARWYNPTTGRWTQHDTLDAPLDPANANRYAYAANDPINNTDPTGAVTDECALSYAGLVLGAALWVAAAPVSAPVTVGTGILVGAGILGMGIGATSTVLSCS